MPNGWGSVETVAQKYIDPKLDMTKDQIANAAKNPPLPLPPHEGVSADLVSEAWDKVSRLWPEMAREITKISEYDPATVPLGFAPPNAFINPHSGELAVRPGEKLDPTTLWHELVHREQAIRGAIKPGAGRSDMEPDEFNEIESEAHQRGNASAELFKRFDAERAEQHREKQAALGAVAGGADAMQMTAPHLPPPEKMEAAPAGKAEPFPSLLDLIDRMTHNGQFPSYVVMPEDQQEIEEVAGPELEAWRAERQVHQKLPTINEQASHRAKFEKAYDALRTAYLTKRKTPEAATAQELPKTFREQLADFQNRSPEGYAEAIEAYRIQPVNMEQATRKPPPAPPAAPPMPAPEPEDLPPTKLDVSLPSYLEGEEPARRTKIDPIQPTPAPDTQIAPRSGEELIAPSLDTNVPRSMPTGVEIPLAEAEEEKTAIEPQVLLEPPPPPVARPTPRSEQDKISRLIHGAGEQNKIETAVEMPQAGEPLPVVAAPSHVEGVPWARVLDDTPVREGDKKTHLGTGEPKHGPETQIGPDGMLQEQTGLHYGAPSTQLKPEKPQVYNFAEPPPDQPTSMPTFDLVEYLETYETSSVREDKHEIGEGYRVQPQRAPHFAGGLAEDNLPLLEEPPFHFVNQGTREELEAANILGRGKGHGPVEIGDTGTYGVEGEKKPLEDMWPRADVETHLHMPVSEEQLEELEKENWRDRKAAQFHMPSFRDYRAGEDQTLSEWGRPEGQRGEFSMPSANETHDAFSMPSMNEMPGGSSVPMGGGADADADGGTGEDAFEDLVEAVKKNTEALHKLIEALGNHANAADYGGATKTRSTEFKGSGRKSTPHGNSPEQMLAKAIMNLGGMMLKPLVP